MDEPLPPNKVVGYCEKCEHWTKFDTKSMDVLMNGQKCEVCGGLFSSRIGYQITTQRTFNPGLKRKKLTKKDTAA